MLEYNVGSPSVNSRIAVQLPLSPIRLKEIRSGHFRKVGNAYNYYQAVLQTLMIRFQNPLRVRCGIKATHQSEDRTPDAAVGTSAGA